MGWARPTLAALAMVAAASPWPRTQLRAALLEPGLDLIGAAAVALLEAAMRRLDR